jgi:uncharacterized membrane protein (DUF4010 family)
MSIVDCIPTVAAVGPDPTHVEAVLTTPVGRLSVAVALGLALGLEREWSKKPAGIRTFSLVSLLGAVFATLDRPLLVVVGGLLVVLQGLFLAVSSVRDPDLEGLALTTATSLLLAYAVGVLVGDGFVFEATVVGLLAAFLLVVKRELHEFAWGLSKEEVRSAIELSIVAFVVYPLLPPAPVDPWGIVAPRTVWLLVVAVGAVGFTNYVVLRTYGSEGIAMTGFFGGLVNSTAVIGEVASLAQRLPRLRHVVVGSVLLADAAMAARNVLLAAAFAPRVGVLVAVPLGAVVLTGVVGGWRLCRTDEAVSPDLHSPFSLVHALRFGALFLVVLVATELARAAFGAAGFVATSFLAGLVSSGSATTTAVSLVVSGGVTPTTAATGILASTVASIAVKLALVSSFDRSLLAPVGRWSVGLAGVSVLGFLPVALGGW